MKISVVIPCHQMENWQFFLKRSIESVKNQSFKDYEIVISDDSGVDDRKLMEFLWNEIDIGPFTWAQRVKGELKGMARNSNRAIKYARGELIKILYMDDYLAHENSLQMIVDKFKENDTWLVTGCIHQDKTNQLTNPHVPTYSEEIYTGKNTIGSPSVLTFKRERGLLFDERLSWLLDCDLYKRYFDAYGRPKILDDINVVIGLHDGQTSNLMSYADKSLEHGLVMGKHYKGETKVKEMYKYEN
jgi:glycosyltransferase involved in cell wall biosynthesis